MNEMEWNGMEWNGMEWNGMERNGMEWNGMEWNGMEWNGMEWNGMERPRRRSWRRARLVVEVTRDARGSRTARPPLEKEPGQDQVEVTCCIRVLSGHRSNSNGRDDRGKRSTRAHRQRRHLAEERAERERDRYS